jgi:RNA polymerase sigma-70 factor, ECF subfamily
MAHDVRNPRAIQLAKKNAESLLFSEHRNLLWSLSYRMCGSAADAEDLVQETFIRFLERPPANTDEALRPWLVTVLLNLTRDHLRKRKRIQYVGPWLPTPIASQDAMLGWEVIAESKPADEDIRVSPEARYSLLESVSFAFLLALEALTPSYRAILLLRDVFDYSIKETADVLQVSEASVKTGLHRARVRMADYEQSKERQTKQMTPACWQSLQLLFSSFINQDREAFAKQLSDDVVMMNDGGGEFFAARIPVVGAEKITKFTFKVNQAQSELAQMMVMSFNGQPALVSYDPNAKKGTAKLGITLFEFDANHQIRRLYSVVATAKIRHLLSALPLAIGDI